MLPTSYQPLYPGASGGNADPYAESYLQGASHLNAGQFLGANRNAYALAPGAGQAPSLRPVDLEGPVPATDQSHNNVLDGHEFSQVSSHPDGLFALNTAATSNHSLNANYAHFQRDLLTLGLPSEALSYKANQPLENPSLPSLPVSTSRLYEDRDNWLQGVGGGPEIMVKNIPAARSRISSLLTRDWTGSELGLMGLGLYGAYFVAARG